MEDLKYAVAIILGALVFCLSMTLFGAYLEAKAFNKFTQGPKATTWDALFAELRVDAK